MGVEEHRRTAPGALAVAIITVSDTRDLDSDLSGREIERLLREAGHRVTGRVVVRDEPAAVEAALRQRIADRGVDAVILDGGTGLARRDGTVEVVEALLDREIPGFGELFRSLSYGEIGAAAMLSRAVAGIAGGTAVFSLPGSTAAVKLAMEKLILPELGHVIREVRR
jgi:molybdenum cofactor biosynthesis protein B